jgi:Xaa-Pro aminopeptidase
MVKTNEEIKRIKQAAEINEKGLQALLDSIQEGKTENEVAKAHDDTLVALGCRPYHTCVQGGTRGALINGEPTEYRFRMGDGIRLDFDCIFSGYFSDIARTAVVGQPSQKLKTYQNAVMQGVLAAEEIIKPGITVSQIYNVCVEAVRKSGIPHFNRHHIGHGIGLECYDLPLVNGRNEMQLEAGTVFNLETPYYEIGFGCAHVEDTVLVTETGCERLQKTGLELKITG